MKRNGIMNKWIASGVAVLALSVFSAQAQMQQGTAEVRNISGSAKYSSGGGVWVPLKVGTVLRPGSVVQTAADSTVDLDLAQNGPVVRVTGDTTLGIDRLNFQRGGGDAGTTIDTQLDLQVGRILGHVKKMTASSKYEIKLPNGVAGIRGTDYDISVRPLGNNRYDIRVTSIEGTLIGSAVVNGQTYTGVVNTGESWSPETGVTRAPAPLLAEARRIIGDITGILRPTLPTPPSPIETIVSPRTGARSGTGS
jgi:hypothetical protein